MANEKRYYWLKFREDFFSSMRIKKLRKMAGGDTYIIIYLKMQLKALKTDGILEYKGIEQEFADELALDIDESPDDVRVVLAFLTSYGMCECSDNIHYFLPFVVENTGSETAGTQRWRDWKNRKDALKETTLLNDNQRDLLESNNLPTICQQNANAEKEIEIEIEKDKEKDNNIAHQKVSDAAVMEQFDEFWKEYPRKKGKGDARKKFAKALTKTSFENIMDALRRVKKSKQWNRDGGDFVPYPGTWLNQERWDDSDDNQETDRYANLRRLAEEFDDE